VPPLDRTGGAFYAIALRPTTAGTTLRPHLESTVRTLFSLSMLLALLNLTGCHLIDQTDFRGAPPVPTAPPPVPEPDQRSALVTIDYTKANPDYAAALTAVVAAVEQRRPGALYDVISIIGSSSDAELGQNRAADVMTAIEARHVIPARIQLGQRIEPGRKAQQVRVYLR
jgi:hypothetical protein